jgi:hypothetical protein
VCFIAVTDLGVGNFFYPKRSTLKHKEKFPLIMTSKRKNIRSELFLKIIPLDDHFI